MPLTNDMRRKIDQIRDYLFGGGYPDPMSNAEQLAFLFFFYLIEGIDAENQMTAELYKQPFTSIFEGDWQLKNPLNADKPGALSIPKSRFRWSVWAKGLSGEALVRFVRDEAFAFFGEVAQQSAVNFMAGARLSIDEPTVFTQIITLVDGLRLEEADADTKGDLFEHVLRQIKQAGELGQFRTPRHVIRTIVEMVNPQVGETIYDPAAGTAGFLVAAYNHIRLQHSSEAGRELADVDGKQVLRGIGDRLSLEDAQTLANRTFYGNDVDPKMVRLSSMNLTLRGLPNVRILLRNVLTTTLDDSRREELGLPQTYSVVLANPPFSGRVDKDRIVEDVKIGSTTATELLFLKYMLDSLAPGGRCGVIIPEGVLFGSTGAHKELRRMLLENNTVEAVLSLPGGVFQPYSGVKTSVLFFKKGGSTREVLFLQADNDGFKLDANHDTPIEADDLPQLAACYASRFDLLRQWQGRDDKAEWPEKWWFADLAALKVADFNLSAGRYRPLTQTAAVHRSPKEILDELAAIQVEIAEEVEALRSALAEGGQ
ncbi:N-6 DNA methylase [Uliginosibacterium sp. 31-16]|uniref:HsdM family class I SAM-dependent methyltransferase n=1 Tax=Uliginosibacterium sp. 31-16 TaxID=3068315 RepID=UPI00273E8FBE|nr:N-6 DNA methylase [Uliginosibacterium sp. 31-16]MDP5239121.1 N-6 DNA methylase [Uliginosibacterium sp. 31-16]